MNCKDCKHWKKETGYPQSFNLGTCNKVVMFWDSTEWGEDSSGETVLNLTDEAKGNLAFVQDGSDYSADLLTLAQFGCVQFEAAEQQQ